MSQSTPPEIKKGTVLTTGLYWRNLKKDDVKRRYRNDTSDPPKYGYRVSFEGLYGWDSEPYELSVNISSCTNCICSIWLHPAPHTFKHVGLIDIEKLSERMGMKVFAVYTPTLEDPDDDDSAIVNPCHCDLSPEGDIDVFCSLLKGVSWLEFPAHTAQSLKKPTTEDDIKKALSAQSLFENVIGIHFNVMASR